MFEAVAPDVPLSQGDVLDDCPVFGLEPGSPVDLAAVPTRWSVRVIVLTQACDLAQAKASRVLVALVHTARLLVESGVVKAALVRDQVRRGLVYGWYFLPASSQPALPESLVDLRDVHTVARPVLERLIADGKRLGRLPTPYREHLAQHFAVTYSRIGLPEPYESQP